LPSSSTGLYSWQTDPQGHYLSSHKTEDITLSHSGGKHKILEKLFWAGRLQEHLKPRTDLKCYKFQATIPNTSNRVCINNLHPHKVDRRYLCHFQDHIYFACCLVE
jgi:hypothetical protein